MAVDKELIDMKIVLDDKVVGQLTDDGEIVTEDMWLRELASKIKQ